jgi:hypothetical protein
MRAVLLVLTLTLSLNAAIHVFSPDKLRLKFTEGQIPNTIADFGVVPYGHSISGRVVRSEPFDACDPLEISEKFLKEIQGNFIILAERGRCTFSQKVINAQKIGASAVLISDSDKNKDVHKIFAVERVKTQLDQVRIPSMLINKVDSDSVEKMINSGEIVEMGINFELRKAEGKSRLSFILSVDDYRCYDSLLNMHKHFLDFKKSMDVTVHYKVFRNVNVLNSTECLSNQDNKFCILKSYGNKLEKQGLMQETLRQMCIYRHGRAAFFDYLRNVRDLCFGADGTENSIKNGFSNCTGAIFAKTFGELDDIKSLDTGDSSLPHIPKPDPSKKWDGIDNVKKSDLPHDTKEKILECSLVFGDEVSNILEENNDDIKYYLINYSPLIFINGVYYKGNFDDTQHLLDAFCSSFEKEPKECEGLEAYKILRATDTSEFFDYLLKIFFVTLIIIITLVIIFYIFYKRRIRGYFDSELHNKINQAIANYYGTSPVDIDTMKLTKKEKDDLDILVKKLDQMAYSSYKESKSAMSVPVGSSGKKKENFDSKSLMNLHKVQDQIESDEDYDPNPNNKTFS